jgi:hypothetical protein
MSWLASFFGAAADTTPTSAQPIEVVMYLASLASRPQEIDGIMDGLRMITAKQKPGLEALSKEEQLALADVYLQLQKYLIEKEPVRVFSKEELMAKVRAKFQMQEKDAFFWERVGYAAYRS